MGIIELSRISRIYDTGYSKIFALDDVSLSIERGEFVAIMGPSGSGKSTLLNILGFLDRPDHGQYYLDGVDVSTMDDKALSGIRNRYAGFVFQQFHLLSRMSALQNVELPLMYGGIKERSGQARTHLQAVGLGDRTAHLPVELSGGEQQRVAIARSLVNDPDIIFADEPTGNLDSKSEKEIMSIIQELSRRGKTVVMVTHEHEVAEYASRVIRMRDGKITGDKKKKKRSPASSDRGDSTIQRSTAHAGVHGADIGEYIIQAFRFMFSHKLRSLLSMLGILIGVASVISMLAIGNGAKKSIEDRLKSLGTNLLTLRAGAQNSGGARLQAGSVNSITFDDVDALSGVSGIERLSPNIRSRVQLVYGNKNWNTQLMGVGKDYTAMHSLIPANGRGITEYDMTTRRMVALVGETVIEELFDNENPVGKHIRINSLLFTVVGVLPSKGMSFMHDQDDVVLVPITTALYRVLGERYVESIDIEVEDERRLDEVSEGVTSLMNRRHHITDETASFEIMDMTEIRKTMSSTTETMSLLLGFVSGISLIVGGIGIMNIMLVSVKERTREIGLRKAIGADRRSILLQFLIEALLMTLVGGMLGIGAGFVSSFIISATTGWYVAITIGSVLISTLFSGLIGMVFGFWPAVLASKLHPIDALRYE